MIWLVDHWACSLLIDARHFIGVPFAFLLEFHGWYVLIPASTRTEADETGGTS